jgi:hypothetical protein
MIRKLIAVLAVVLAFSALPAIGQDTGPVKTVPNTGPVRTVPDTPAPNEVAPDQAAPNQTAPSDAAPEAEGSRFVFHRVQDSFVRLDSRTGQVSLCSRRTVGWTCQVAPDDRNVLEREIARLRADNALLKKEFLTRGLPLPGGIKPTPPAADGSKQLKLPTEADFDRVVAFIQKAWNRLVEMIVNLQKDVMKKS